MAAQAFSNTTPSGDKRKRLNGFELDPFEELCIIGIDTDHKSREEHFYFDDRVLLPLDPLKIRNVVRDGIITDVEYIRIDCSKDPKFPKKWRDKGRIAIVLEGRQRVRWAREATLIRQKDGHLAPIVMVPSRPMEGDQLQNWIRSRSANFAREEPTPTAMAREMLTLRGMGCTDETIAITCCCEVEDIVPTLRYLELSPRIITGLDNRGITKSAANLFLSSGMTHVEQDERLDALEKDGFKLTVENVRAAIRSSKVPRSPKAPGSGKEDDEDLAGPKLTLKQIHKIGALAEKGEIECDPMLAKLLNAIRGKTAGKGIKGWTALLREIGAEV